MNATFAQTPMGYLLAWIERLDTDAYIGAFVGEDAAPGMSRHFAGRVPAAQLCASADEAREWIEDQAAAFGLPVKWVDRVPQG